MPHPSEMSIDDLQRIADQAGLGMTREEVEEVKPIYDLYAGYAYELHQISFGATEMVVEFPSRLAGGIAVSITMEQSAQTKE